MAAAQSEQTRRELRIGVDVGGTFTDLVASDGQALQIVKVVSTPPEFHLGVVEAVKRVAALDRRMRIIHGSTVATNALLQRAGEPVAFVTTEGFRDMLLIGRQNRPKLYALHVVRPAPITPEENWFTVRERIDSSGNIVMPLDDREIAQLIGTIKARKLQHVAVCLLFSFANPVHERRVGEMCARAGLTVSLSCDVMPEFREYERASTTAINASLRPTVQAYLQSLEQSLSKEVSGQRSEVSSGRAALTPDPSPLTPSLRIMHSGGGTLSVADAASQAAKLVLSGPAGGVIGAAYVAALAGFDDIVTYDMGGTSTDVATILGRQPQWTTATAIDGLPIGLPMFDIHTVGAGGGSIASLDVGGALRVGPQSAGAVPGPACYGRGGTLPTVTDANLILGRIIPGHFLGGAMHVDADLAKNAIQPLADSMSRSLLEAALGIIRVAESNMAHAVRAVTSRRGHDPRRFTLVSFGGAGGLHACALAELLDISAVLIPPYAGVLSALGMVVAPAVVDAAKTVAHLSEQLDDARLAAEFGYLNGLASDQLSNADTAQVEAYADVRFHGQSHEVKVRVERPSLEAIDQSFRGAYENLYGQLPPNRRAQIVTLRLRRVGRTPELALPPITPDSEPPATITVTTSTAERPSAPALTRAKLLHIGKATGPALLIDHEATTYIPPNWAAECRATGQVILERKMAC